jgi:hypothetical protein
MGGLFVVMPMTSETYEVAYFDLVIQSQLPTDKKILSTTWVSFDGTRAVVSLKFYDRTEEQWLFHMKDGEAFLYNGHEIPNATLHGKSGSECFVLSVRYEQNHIRIISIGKFNRLLSLEFDAIHDGSVLMYHVDKETGYHHVTVLQDAEIYGLSLCEISEQG